MIYIDIDPNDLQLLVDMFKELVWASEIDIPERFNKYLGL